MSAQVSVDRTVCELHGQCVAAAPAVFSFDSDGELVVGQPIAAEETAAVADAQFLCPTQAITLARES